MTPTAIIQKALADGVTLSRSPTGSIKATGNSAAVNRWLPAIREHKAELIAALRLVVPGEIERLIGQVMRLRDCPDADREAFAADWRQDPEGIEQALKHLANHYGGNHGR